MEDRVMKAVFGVVGLLVLVAAGACIWLWSGAYNVAADEPHWPVTAWFLETARDRSIESRAESLVVPDLNREALVRAGAGNYDAMCSGCHLHPGADHSEMSVGLNPAPPNLARRRSVDPAEAFWVIKHGIKMTAMPAWGRSMDDEAIWGMVAFMQKLHDMSDEDYDALVESSEGHKHGPAGAEDMHHEHGADHVHADDSKHEHGD
jgi:mono/diheme cytochrome c family protein